MLWTHDCSQMLTLGRNNPEPARSREIQVSLLVHFHAVPGVFTRRGGSIKKDFAICERAVGPYFVPHDDFPLEVPVIDVQKSLVWRKRQSIGPVQVGGHQFQFAVYDAEHTAK